MVVQITHAKGQFLGKGRAKACLTTLPGAVQKWLNRSRRCLGCGLG